MAKKLLPLFLIITIFSYAKAQSIQAPSDFLGYKLGTHFTFHSRIAEYFRYVSQASKNVKLLQYGTTNEGRPLLVAFIGTEANIKRLDEIQKYNLSLAGLDKSPAISNPPVIVWLSFNVHGNEPSSSEAAMQTLFDLVDSSNTRTQAWLANTVIVIDPCLNPDGRDRYVNYFNQVGNISPDASPFSREHTEPWPGGRVNHYYFDLNRDWAWQVQKETQARVGLYNQWLPQVHVDFHEQGINSPYYFAPAAEPFHKAITSWQREFQTTIGKNNAKYFDEQGWMYFTREEFDLLYPSYGDTYPLYNGSIGMTYEQGGGVAGGLAVQTKSGDTLTLVDRIAHHHSNALSTVETASKQAAKVLSEYKKFFDDSRTNPTGEYKTYVIKDDNKDKVAALAKMLDRNGIQYSFGLSKTIPAAYNYFSTKTEAFNISSDDMVINTYQPKSVLLNVLFEPKTFVADSNTYDITAWSLPYAYGLKAYGLKESVKGTEIGATHTVEAPMNVTKAYAYVSSWQSVEDVKFLAALLKKGIKVRYAENAFETGGKKFSAGSLIITKAGNNRPDFDKLIAETANIYGRSLSPLNSGFVDKGADIGSKEVHFINRPQIMLLTNEGTSSNSMGEIWHFFEQQLGYPVTLVRYQDLGRVKLSDFGVLIVPDGNYNDLPSDKLASWIRDGGKLIVMGDAIGSLDEKKGFMAKSKEKKDDKDEDKKKVKEVKIYGERDHEALRSSVPGAIYKLKLDNTHPLGFGFPNYYYDLKLDDTVYELLGDGGWNVGTIKKDGYVAGFVGEKSKEKIADGMLLGVQNMGRGTVVYMVDDPLFREFWENGKLLFSNAVFMVGQ